MPHLHRKKTQKRAKNNKQQYNLVLDRSKQLSDGTVGTAQDSFEFKAQTNTPPTRIPSNFARQCYWYKGTADLGTIATSTTVPTGATFSFKLSDLNLEPGLIALFDQYAIVQVTVRITPQINVGDTATVRSGLMVSVIDHDDSNGLLTLGQAQEYSSALTTSGLKGHTRVILPRIAGAVYSGAFTSFSNIRSYIDAGYPNVQHFGIKVYLSQSFGQIYTYNVDADYIVHLRDTH